MRELQGRHLIREKTALVMRMKWSKRGGICFGAEVVPDKMKVTFDLPHCPTLPCPRALKKGLSRFIHSHLFNAHSKGGINNLFQCRVTPPTGICILTG